MKKICLGLPSVCDISDSNDCTPRDTVENMKLLVCHAVTSMEHEFVMSLCHQTTVVTVSFYILVSPFDWACL